MAIDEGRLETADALEFANLSRGDWNNAIQRGIYLAAPETDPGRPRLFDVDDLIAAYVLGWLFERQVQANFACQIAHDVLTQIRKTPTTKKLSAWKCVKPWAANKPAVVVSARAPQRDAVELFQFDIGDIRRQAIKGIRQKMALKGAS